MVIGKLPILNATLARLGRAGLCCALIGIAALFLVAEAGQPLASQPPAIAGVDQHLEAGERSARFRMMLSARVEPSIDVLSDPMRVVVDMPEVNFQASRLSRKAGSLVQGVRAGLVAPGRSRLVFDLGAPGLVSDVKQVQRGNGVVEFTLQFEAASAAEFARAVTVGAERRARAALQPLAPAPPSEDSRPLVVIDPGHGGIDPGAVAQGGITEKAVVLAIGLKLKQAIEADGRARVLMTRSDDRFLSLSDRVRLAREARADLFVSLHADSLSASQEVRGATIYTGSERATDRESARLAQKENAADALAGAETGPDRGEINDILMDLARRETRIMSGAAAARLVTEMSGAVRMHRIPQRAAGFRVLTAPDVPSILIELGFLSSERDMALLTSADWQMTAATAIARAVRAHFSGTVAGERRGASISP